MIKNYLKTAFRQLWRNKFYSLINIFGLAIGLASCLLIFLYVQDELSYDQFHKNKDRIYRITEEFKTGDGVMSTALTPHKLSFDLKQNFPQIEKAVRIDFDIEKHIIKAGDKKFVEESITSADPDFFNFFSFPLLQGDPNKVLTDPYTVAISDKMAMKYFANGDAMGKMMEFSNAQNYKSFNVKVTGVFKAMPSNSHFHKDFILSSATADILIPERKDELGWTSHFTYFLFKPGTDPAKMEKAFNTHIFKTFPKEVTTWLSKFRLQSLNDIHLRSNEKEELEPNGDIAYVYIFSAIALFLMILASINYMNLATARAASRAREVGVRKVIGALKRQLVFQFLSESFIITLLAMIIAGSMSVLALPLFNELSGKELSVNFIDLRLLTIILLTTLVIGILSGSYPAFFLSGFQPVKVLKGTLAKTGQKSLLLRRGLVVLQFSISITLIIGTIIIYKQWNYLQNKKTGLDTDQIVSIPLHTEVLRKNYPFLKNSLLGREGIISVTASSKDLINRFGNYTGVSIQGRDGYKVMPWASLDSNFFTTFNIPIAEGSLFSGNRDTDSIGNFMINQAAVKQLDLKTPVGTNIEVFGKKGRISGVVKDFHFESLHSQLSPVIFSTGSSGFSSMSVKIKGSGYKKTISLVEKEYKKADPNAEFSYAFLDDKMIAMYKTEARFFSVFTTFSALAIFVACLGIFGLASFTAAQRTKEIGIRKVLGASVQNISLLLTREFIGLVIIANLIAWPMAFLLMQKWLEDFPYRIDQNIWMFILAAIAAILIAVLTVSSQAIKAALSNPIKNLRTE